MKKPLKIILIILAVLVGLVAALLIWLTATQLNVKTETAVVTRTAPPASPRATAYPS